MPQGIKAKQSLGQNFLSDPNTADSIVRAMNLQPTDHVLEIGPGFGVLTRRIAPNVERLTSVEIDRRLAEQVKNEMRDVDNFNLVLQDFLKFSFDDIDIQKKLRVVGNVPYNITSPILFKVFEHRDKVSDLIMLIQKEVGERIVAGPNSKDYGILAVFSQAFADVELLLKVPPTVFRPKPKVDSALIRWKFTSERSQHIQDEALFRKMVKQAFGQRRKMLRKSLKNIIENSQVEFDYTRRPEQLSVHEWIAFVNQFVENRAPKAK